MDRQFFNDVGTGLRDAAYRGFGALVGGPVDLATMVMRPLGYKTPDNQVVGGSEWVGQKMQDAGLVSSSRNPVAEFLAAALIPGGMAKAGPKIYAAEQKAVQNAMAPRTLNPQTGAVLFHGGELVRNPVADKQGAFVNGVPVVSFTNSPLSAARYAQANSGNIYGLDDAGLNIYKYGTKPEIDAAINSSNDLAFLKNQGFDGADISAIAGGNETIIFDPALAFERSKILAKPSTDIYSTRRFEKVK